MIKRGLFNDFDKIIFENLPDFDAVSFVQSLRPNDLLQKAGTYSDVYTLIEGLDIPSETKKVVEDALTDKIRQLLEQFKAEENEMHMIYDYRSRP